MSKEKMANLKKNEDRRSAKGRSKKGTVEKKSSQNDISAAFPSLQHQIGNRAVQRLIAQRSGGAEGPFELDDATAGKIQSARGGGQPLDGGVQEQMSASFGEDFSGVRVHTSAEDDVLNHQLGAKAFTTGSDIFFREGEYDPHSSGGQELLAHELTHVLQQGGGAPSAGSRMTVNAPGDSFEHEAESAASAVTAPGAASVQRQELDKKDEAMLQKAPAMEEEEGAVQMAPALEEKDEGALQMAPELEEKDEGAVQKAEAVDEKKEMDVK